jgi:hypothetical protein
VDPHADKTIAVLTKLDLLCKQGEEVAKSRLDRIVRKTKEPRVVVLGKLDPGRTEAQTLGSFDSTLSRYEGEIQLGCADLGGVIEMRMCEHLKRQLPALRKTVRTAPTSFANIGGDEMAGACLNLALARRLVPWNAVDGILARKYPTGLLAGLLCVECSS